MFASSYTLDVFLFNYDKIFYKKSKSSKFLTILLMKGKKGGAKKVDWNKKLVLSKTYKNIKTYAKLKWKGKGYVKD